MAKEYITIEGNAFEMIKKAKGFGIAISIILILLGICLFIEPIASSAVMIWLLVAGILISGIHKIISFIQMPKGNRDGFLLAAGILLVISSLILIGRGFNYEYSTTASIEVCIAFMIAFTCFFTGIGRICGSGLIKEAGGSQGLAILAGILDIVCGMLLMASPLFGLFTLTIIFGLYLAISGVALLIRLISL